ncbi:Competence protein A [Phycisphaerae bacterium RAS1]|nr:Competence protein A [Phycisphaerae bacterium RAS1]
MALRRSQSAVALDVGAAGVAMCRLARRGDRIALDGWNLLEDPLRDRPADPREDPIVRQRVARLVRQQRWQGCDAAVALKPPDVAFHFAAVPEAMESSPREQWLTMLRFEAARQMKAEPDELEVDFWRLPQAARGGVGVLIAAVRRETLDVWCGLLDEVGLIPARVDAAPCALVRAAQRGVTDAEPSALWGVLDIGMNSALLVLFKNQTCVFVRGLSVTGDSLTAGVQEALGVDFHTAETLKRTYRPPYRSDAGQRAEDVGGDVATAVAADVRSVVHGLVRTRVRVMASEIERAFGYIMENNPDAVPRTLWLSGGGSRLSGLAPMLHGLLGIGVELLDPCGDVAVGRGAAAPSESQRAKLALCIGAAMGDFI